MADNQNTFLLQDQDYIKLSKNSRGYTWDIKVIGHNIDKLEELNKEMEKRFSTKPILQDDD